MIFRFSKNKQGLIAIDKILNNYYVLFSQHHTKFDIGRT